jgi:hypothetical protein
LEDGKQGEAQFFCPPKLTYRQGQESSRKHFLEMESGLIFIISDPDGSPII